VDDSNRTMSLVEIVLTHYPGTRSLARTADNRYNI
jgi:hypothetical protein